MIPISLPVIPAQRDRPFRVERDRFWSFPGISGHDLGIANQGIGMTSYGARMVLRILKRTGTLPVL